MTTRPVLIAAALIGLAASAATATAAPRAQRLRAATPAPVATEWSAYHRYGGHPGYGSCPASSAAEGNAMQQTRPVMQYGQTSGGNRC